MKHSMEGRISEIQINSAILYPILTIWLAISVKNAKKKYITCKYVDIDCVWQGIIWLARVVTRIRQLTVRYHQVTPTKDLEVSHDHFWHMSCSFTKLNLFIF